MYSKYLATSLPAEGSLLFVSGEWPLGVPARKSLSGNINYFHLQ